MTDRSFEDRRRVKLDVFIAAPPATVWKFWIDPKRMCQWWGLTAELVPEPGGIFRVALGEDGPVMLGEYVELVPYERMVFLFGWAEGAYPEVPPSSTRVEVMLVAEGQGTRLILDHTELPAGSDDAHTQGWTHFLGILVGAVEEG